MNDHSRKSPEACARSVYEKRYPQAAVVFLAGSVIRGEGTRSSDLDLVVMYEHVHHAYRESFVADSWPVEAFVHDPQTLKYFLGTDRASGVPTLAAMIAGGIALPGENEFARAIRLSATEAMHEGPPAWSDEERNFCRYSITDVIEDLREPRSRAEYHASVARLHEMLANYFLRSRGLWSARGKAIVRRLDQVDRPFAEAFARAFESAFADASSAALLSLAEAVLAPQGGLLFEGYRADAPEGWRTS